MNSEDASTSRITAKEGLVIDLWKITQCDHNGENLSGTEERCILAMEKNETRQWTMSTTRI
ncbi:MAG: hypothetical protein CMB45_04945 [Euryarchaeota archaeon]|nr:hypothetical protein [Euryarchaeota archaeon]|tara:strand:+ start:2950 stop:3132 length:183 start_codon:yes stop_codon:yes gene_type:complete